jgi:hypothetical protein
LKINAALGTTTLATLETKADAAEVRKVHSAFAYDDGAAAIRDR